MKGVLKKSAAFVMALMMVITSVPEVAQAAAEPAFKKTYDNVYENSSAEGQYTYTLKNLKKGYVVKWSVSGKGKGYVTLAEKKTTATKKSVTNTVTVNTNGESGAAGKRYRLSAKVYSGKTLIKKVSTIATINVICEDLEISGDTSVYLNESATYKYTATPSNTNYTIKWSAADESGNDVSAMITSSGAFTPTKTGTYTIKATAYSIKGKAAVYAQKNVTVTNPIKSVKQTKVNEIEVTYYGDASDTYKASDYILVGKSSGTISVSETSFSSDGKTATLTLASNMTDGDTYTLTSDSVAKTFTASCGKPVTFSIITESVTVGKASAISYAVYDSNGIDVTGIYPGSVTYTTALNNAIDESTQKLTITTVGVSAAVTGTYKETNLDITLSASKTITCVSATKSSSTNFTITDSTDEPSYDTSGYADVRKIAVGSTGYIHFRALDTDGTAFAYTSVSYTSSNPDVVSVTSSGKVAAYSAGTVTLTITCVYGTSVYKYEYTVTASAAAYLESISLSPSAVTISNVYLSNYSKTIAVSAKDQYSDTFSLSNETATIKKTSGTATPTVSYDSSKNIINITARGATAGTASYTLSVTSGGVTVTASFTVTVVAVPSSGTVTYDAEVSQSSIDVTATSDLTASKTLSASVANYKGGVFAGYTTITSATITKGGLYYTADLTAGGSSSKITLSPGTTLNITALSMGTSTITKAETGTYTVALTYYSSAAKASVTDTVTFTVTDTDTSPSLTVKRTTSSATCNAALDLVKDCISTSKGEITGCSVYGVTTGGETACVSGENYNITDVTVCVPYTINSKTYNCYYILSLGKTLANK